MNRVIPFKEVCKTYDNGYQLCLQQVVYQYSEGTGDIGFRFIRKTPQGALQAHRGQARINTLEDAQMLIEDMKKLLSNS